MITVEQAETIVSLNNKTKTIKKALSWFEKGNQCHLHCSLPLAIESDIGSALGLHSKEINSLLQAKLVEHLNSKLSEVREELESAQNPFPGRVVETIEETFDERLVPRS